MSIAKQRTKVIDLLNATDFGKEVTVMGWVRSRRGNKYVQFVHINDGSIIHNFQVVFDMNKFSEQDLRAITTGSCISVTGQLVQSQGKGQASEVQADKFQVFGTCDTEEFPLQKRGQKDNSGKVIGGPSLDTLREIAHLRPRTNTFGAVFRIRHTLAYAIHKYFNDQGFFYLHTPIITGSDAEGAGEMFRVSTLDAANPPRNPDGSVDFSHDFFGKQTNLTVSGQLEGELGALALGLIYTFGPTFRAENSNTPRHLAEFWMIEPEMAFYDLEDNMDLAEDFLKYLIRYALENCAHDLEFLNNTYDKELLNRLKSVVSNPFERLSYTDAVEVLKNSGKKFEFAVQWGSDLQKEHENYLVEHFGKPVILTSYPKEIKSFYMKLDEDGRTVRAMDVLFPWIGEIIGGSQREESYEKLLGRIHELGLPEELYWWYLDSRKFGTAPHSGFGLGFERLVMFVTGMTNIRDVIPFPRTPKSAEF